MLSKAWVDVQFLSQTVCWIVSPHRNLSNLLWCNMAQIHSRSQQLRALAMLLCSGVSWVVRWCSVPWELRWAVNLLLVYYHHDHCEVIQSWCCAEFASRLWSSGRPQRSHPLIVGVQHRCSAVISKQWIIFVFADGFGLSDPFSCCFCVLTWVAQSCISPPFQLNPTNQSILY